MSRAIKLLSGEWTLHIVWVLSRNGPTRHGELKRLLDGISSKVLSDRLRVLQSARLVYREQEATTPPKVTYGLTPAGAKIDKALNALEEVADGWVPILP